MTDWEARYQQGDTPWDKGAAAPPLVELLERHGVDLFGDGPVWVPGCGTGHDVRLLAARGIRALGVDIAAGAIQRAQSHPRVADEEYEKLDVLDAGPLEHRRASAIWEHTCFCAIDPSRRGDYASAAGALLEPGGVLAGVFFLNPYDPGEERCGPPFGATRREIDTCLGPWFERIDDWVPTQTYPCRQGREWVAVYRRFTPS